MRVWGNLWLSGSFRLLATSGVSWPGPTDNTDHPAISHFQCSAFWMEEWVFQLSYWKDNPVYLTFLVSLEFCGRKDLCAVFPTFCAIFCLWRAESVLLVQYPVEATFQSGTLAPLTIVLKEWRHCSNPCPNL